MRYAIIVSGLRRTGKSVLLDQLIDLSSSSGLLKSPVNFLKYSFENEDLLSLSPIEDLEFVLNYYFSTVLNSHPKLVGERTFILLDEIQNVRNWQSVIKKYYDLNPNIKFLLSGSSSLYLNDFSESLAGRTVEYELKCLDFEEFIWFSKSDLEIPFLKSLSKTDALMPFYHTNKCSELFEAFLQIGGFPDTAKMYSEGIEIPIILKFVRESIINKVILRDFKRYFNVKDTNYDKKIFEICCAESGSFLQIANLSREISMTQISTKQHLEIFKNSSLVSFLSKYDGKLRREIRSTKKVYVASPCLMYALHTGHYANTPAFLGQAAETYAYHKISNFIEKPFYVLRDKSGEEIDFFIPSEQIGLEVKYSNSVNRSSYSFLKRQAAKREIKPLVITKRDWNLPGVSSFPIYAF